jgi:hypothetical protein
VDRRDQRAATSFELPGAQLLPPESWVSSDILVYLRTGATAEERGLVRDFETGFLVFPDDYLEKLPDTVQQLVEKYEIRLD